MAPERRPPPDDARKGGSASITDCILVTIVAGCIGKKEEAHHDRVRLAAVDHVRLVHQLEAVALDVLRVSTGASSPAIPILEAVGLDAHQQFEPQHVVPHLHVESLPTFRTARHGLVPDVVLGRKDPRELRAERRRGKDCKAARQPRRIRKLGVPLALPDELRSRT